MKKKLKRNYRKAKYVLYKETLVDFKEHFWAFLGSFVGLGIISLLQFRIFSTSDNVFLIGSFGATCVLVYGVIESPLAQPRNLIGGHVISAIIGVSIYKLLPDLIWIAAPLAVSLSIVLMQITNMVGKDGIAIAATGQKALAVIINRFLQIGKGKFDNIVLNTNLASEIADVIGEKADTIRIINGFDTKNIAPQIEEYLNNMFDDEMFLSGKSGKEEFIKNYMDNLYGEGDSSLIVSEILTKATDFRVYN